MCNSSTNGFHQELEICRTNAKGCKSLKFHGVLGKYVDSLTCIPTLKLKNCSFTGFTTTPAVATPANSLHGFLLALSWIMGLMAVVGNLVTICSSLVVLSRKSKVLPKVKKLHNLLLLNLGVADLLMGVYLTTHMVLYSVLGAPPSSVAYQAWKPGNGCTVLGAVSFVSSQVSVTTLALITSCRLYSVIWPYRIIAFKPIGIAIFATWVVWTTIAMVPLMGSEDIFHDSMYVEDDCPDLRFEARYDKWLDILKQMLDTVNCSQIIPENRSWSKVKSILNDMGMFNATKLKTYKYYNELDFCTINYIACRNNPAVGFLLHMISFNLLAFAYMAVAYCCICHYTSSFEHCCLGTRCTTSNLNRREMENSSMHRRIFLLVLTDFACWVPISIIGISRTIHENSVSVQTTHYIIGFLFPINSALNPLLYTNQWYKICKRVYSSAKIRNSQGELVAIPEHCLFGQETRKASGNHVSSYS